MEAIRRKRKQRLYLALVGIISLFIGIQFFNQPLAGKPITGAIEAPKEVRAILERSCYGCHSNEQKLNWLERTAPVSWIVKKDVNRAREVLNFSEWGKYSPAEHEGKMYAILNMLKAGKMPLSPYTLLHPTAKISKKDIAVINAYTLSLSRKDTTANSSFAHPEAIPTISEERFSVSPNGIKYTDAFKNWKVISMSTLFDHSIRVIFGNEIAVKAIEEENFHPWPKGSLVVKAVWEQTEGPDGELRAGKFINAQFMVKDAEQYKNTEGWGFAKFSGQQLIPTGKTALFAQQSCISCHRQLAESTGYLFDVPLKVNRKELISKIIRHE